MLIAQLEKSCAIIVFAPGSAAKSSSSPWRKIVRRGLGNEGEEERIEEFVAAGRIAFG
jgi:hypothetical protein